MSDSSASAPGITQNERRFTFLGCLFLAVSMSAFGLSLANIQGTVLESMNGADSFSLVTAISSAALCIMTPVGGSLMDMLGTRKVVLWFGLLVCISAVALAFVNSLGLYLLLRCLLAGGQGAFASVPFITVRQIYSPDQVPKHTGYLSGALAVGGFIGSWFAGFLADRGMLGLANAFPAVILAIGMFLVVKFYPFNDVVAKKKLDVFGIILLAATLICLVFALNYGPTLGWGSHFVLGMLAGCIVAFILLIYWEKKCQAPLIPLKLFKNKAYVLLLAIAGLCVVYLNAINVYVPQALQQIMGQSGAVSGTVQIPRTILSVIVPGFAGVWVARSTGNYWKALAITAILIILPMACLVFIGPNMPVWFVFAALALTGAADSFRTVATMPAAQSLLNRQDLGIGTSVVGFVISLAGVLASAIFSIAYNGLVQSTPGVEGMTHGIDTVLLISAAAAGIALLLDFFLFRRIYPKALQEAQLKNQQK